MFFVLSKTLGILALPSNFFIAIGLIGLLLLVTRVARWGRRLVFTSVILLAIGGFSPLANWLMYPLETRFPAWQADAGHVPDGVIVLGGGIEPDLSLAHDTPVFNSGVSRIIAAAELMRRYPNLRLIYSGGNSNLIESDAAKEADYVLPLLESFGIARDRLTIENQSRNTIENARFTKQLANPKAGERWLLVTSAFHMPRSIGLFRAVDFPVEAYPCDWHLRGSRDLYEFANIFSRRIGLLDIAAREWLGLLASRISGNSNDLFPGPHSG